MTTAWRDRSAPGLAREAPVTTTTPRAYTKIATKLALRW